MSWFKYPFTGALNAYPAGHTTLVKLVGAETEAKPSNHVSSGKIKVDN
jgi:hypothetical protein